MGIAGWMARAEREGHDSLGALELALGGGVLVGQLCLAMLDRVTWLASVGFYSLLALALWRGHRLEGRVFRAAGERRFRGTLCLRITWLVLTWSLLWACVLLALVHARAWNRLQGWANGPILLALILGLYHLSMGAKIGLRRWICLGLALSFWAVVISGVSVLRHNIHLSTSLLVGGTLLASGYQGQRAFARRVRGLRQR